MNTQFEPAKILVDKGFDSDFGWNRIDELCRLFTKGDVLQEFVYAMHESEQRNRFEACASFTRNC